VQLFGNDSDALDSSGFVTLIGAYQLSCINAGNSIPRESLREEMVTGALFEMFWIVLRVAANIWKGIALLLGKELDSKLVPMASSHKTTLELVVEGEEAWTANIVLQGIQGTKHDLMFAHALAMDATSMESFPELIEPPSTLSLVFVYKKTMPPIQALLMLGFLVLATKGVEGTATTLNASTTSSLNATSILNASTTSSWDISGFVDGIIALILATMWGLRTYLLNQSYTYNHAPYWASLRNKAFYLSLLFIVVAIVTIFLGWVLPTWHTTMQKVVAVVIGALAMATIERRAQGPASTRLKALQYMLQRPYYRDGRTGGHGYSSEFRRLFEERDNIPSSWKGKPFLEGGWDCTLVEITKPSPIWRYYVKPGPINDHFFMGSYQVIEAAGSGYDLLAFAVAYASVTASYMLRPKLKRVMLGIAINIIRNSGRVRSSFQSWRPAALAQLLGIDQLNLPTLSQFNDWPTLIQDTKSIVVLWAVCWLEDASRMQDVMEGIAQSLNEIHANSRPWNRNDVIDEMVDAATRTWIGPLPSITGLV
jgi:hypothetical protein